MAELSIACKTQVDHCLLCCPCPVRPLQMLPLGTSGGTVAIYGVAFFCWGLCIRWARLVGWSWLAGPCGAGQARQGVEAEQSRAGQGRQASLCPCAATSQSPPDGLCTPALPFLAPSPLNKPPHPPWPAAAAGRAPPAPAPSLLRWCPHSCAHWSTRSTEHSRVGGAGWAGGWWVARPLS